MTKNEMNDLPPEAGKSKKMKIILGGLAIGGISLMATCAASVVQRDGSFSFEMYPIPLLIAAVYASGLILIFGMICLGCNLGKSKDGVYVLLSIFFILGMMLIGWSSAPAAIF